MSERVTKVGKNMDHCHLVSNEATCDNDKEAVPTTLSGWLNIVPVAVVMLIFVPFLA